jgi:hypothetical protein
MDGDTQPKRQTDRRAVVAVVGDGTLAEGASSRTLARRLGCALVSAGYRVVCGGRGGVMEEVCRGAHEAPEYLDGSTIGVMPGGSHREANRWVDIVIPTSLGHARNTIVAQADAVVAIGGGAGTLSEIAMAWIHDRLVLAFRVAGWSGRLADTRIDDRTRFPDIEDDRIFGVTTPEEACAMLGRHLTRYRRARLGEGGSP